MNGDTILRVLLNDHPLCEISRAAVPAEEQPSTRLRGEEATLTFIDSAGGKHSYAGPVRGGSAGLRKVRWQLPVPQSASLPQMPRPLSGLPPVSEGSAGRVLRQLPLRRNGTGDGGTARLTRRFAWIRTARRARLYPDLAYRSIYPVPDHVARHPRAAGARSDRAARRTRRAKRGNGDLERRHCLRLMVMPDAPRRRQAHCS